MRTLFLLALAAGLAGTARSADTYDLRGPAPAKGFAYESDETFSMKEGDATLKIGGQTVTFKQSTTATTKEKVKVLAVDGRAVTKVETKVIKDVNETTVTLGGNDQTESKAAPLEGEVVISTREDGKWTSQLVDAKPTDKQEKKLAKRRGPESDDDIYPAEKVAVGHTWSVPAKTLARHFGDDLTDLEGKIEMKFLRIDKLDGEECAVIQSEGTIKGKSVSDEEEAEGTLNMEMTVKVITYRSLKTGFDLQDKMTGKMKVSGEVKIMGSDAEIVVEGPISAEETRTVVK